MGRESVRLFGRIVTLRERNTLAVLWTWLVLLLFLGVRMPDSGRSQSLPVAGQVIGHSILKAFSTTGSGGTTLAQAPEVIFQDRSGEMWLGGITGLFTLTANDAKWQNRSDSLRVTGWFWVHGVGQDKRGDIWIWYGSGGSEFAYRAAGKWCDPREICPASIKSLGRILIPGKDGRIWFASSEGLVAYDGTKWDGPFNPPEREVQDYIRFRPAYPAVGQSRFSVPPASISVDERSLRYWASDAYSGIQDRDGDIWVGSERGIWRFSEKRGDWSLYTTQGLAWRVARIFEDRYGKLWFTDATGRLAQYDKVSASWARYDLASRFPGEHVQVLSVYAQNPRSVILGTQPGVIILDERTGSMLPVPVHSG
ncbi:MAG: hypothetical protein ACREDR_11030, partial [Blastocatellia bacterium]